MRSITSKTTAPIAIAPLIAMLLTWFTRHGDLQFEIGWSFHCGILVAQNDAQAVAWFRETAEQGNTDAQYNLGLMYENGRGVAQDQPQAAAGYRRAAWRDNADAQCKLIRREGIGKQPARE